MSTESSKTQKGDEDIDIPSLRTTPLGKTSGEREKTKDEKKILEGLVGSIESKIQKSKEENLDHNRTQLIESGKEVEMKERHDAGGKIVSEKSEDLRKKFQEKVEQKGSKEKGSTKTGCADYFWKFISWFTCED
uniref:Putative ovule protein n=1 Tax=Solanum chacoense TaxID=4108 RepID=A0A0V0H3Z3_SOLCH